MGDGEEGEWEEGREIKGERWRKRDGQKKRRKERGDREKKKYRETVKAKETEREGEGSEKNEKYIYLHTLMHTYSEKKILYDLRRQRERERGV